MSDLSRIITHGVGPEATIEGFILVGLNTSIIFTGLSIFGIDAKRRIEALDVKEHEAGVVRRKVDTLKVPRRDD